MSTELYDCVSLDAADRTGEKDRLDDVEPTVAICVISYRRLDGLRRLLLSLNDLRFRESRRPRVRLIVVDNDPENTAVDLCRSLAPDLRWPVTATTEPRRGIPFARNTALKVAGTDVDFVAFVDDDEVPDPYWLDALLTAQRQYNADVVSGVVLPYFPEPIPGWLAKGGGFDRKRFPTGTLRPYAATCNVMMRAEVVKDIGPSFNERMALTGGSDTHYFMKVVRAGYRIVHVDDAIVYEWIPASRANVRWLLQRAYRQGNSLTLCYRELYGRNIRLWRRAVTGCARIVAGLVILPLSAIIPVGGVRMRVVNVLRHICRGAGTIMGLVGHKYEEYRNVHQV